MPGNSKASVKKQNSGNKNTKNERETEKNYLKPIANSFLVSTADEKTSFSEKRNVKKKDTCLIF